MALLDTVGILHADHHVMPSVPGIASAERFPTVVFSLRKCQTIPTDQTSLCAIKRFLIRFLTRERDLSIWCCYAQEKVALRKGIIARVVSAQLSISLVS